MSPLIVMPRRRDFNPSLCQDTLPVRFPEDIPTVLQEEFARCCAEHGPPIMAFLSPAIGWPMTRSAVDCPEKIIALFEDSVHVIMQRTHSKQLEDLEISRAHLLGYSIAEFVLDSWLTLYHGVEPSRLTIIPFSVRATEYYRSFTARLCGWLPQKEVVRYTRRQVLPFLPPAGLPLTFSDFLHGHPEIKLQSQPFFQRGLTISRWHRPFWPNLFLGLSDSNVIVISDQYYDYPSAEGLEATFFSFNAVARVTWTDRSLLRRARIAIEIEQGGRTLELSWPACPDLKYAAVDWIERANSRLGNARTDPGAA